MARTRAESPRRSTEQPERRAAPRLDKVFPVYIDGDGGSALGVARNISEGGMFIETRDPQRLGSQVRITFPSRSGEMIAVAEVRYVCHLMGTVSADGAAPRLAAVRGMGVRFLYFDADGVAPPVVH
jgi:PilZ domain